jgi:hypothetical protein
VLSGGRFGGADSRVSLQELVRSLTAVAEGADERNDDPEQGRYRLTLAYYPLDEAEHDPRPGA